MPGIIPHDLWLLPLEPVHVTSECPGACDAEDLGRSGNRDACWRIRWAHPKHVSAGYYYRNPGSDKPHWTSAAPRCIPRAGNGRLGKRGEYHEKASTLIVRRNTICNCPAVRRRRKDDGRRARVLAGSTRDLQEEHARQHSRRDGRAMEIQACACRLVRTGSRRAYHPGGGLHLRRFPADPQNTGGGPPG